MDRRTQIRLKIICARSSESSAYQRLRSARRPRSAASMRRNHSRAL